MYDRNIHWPVFDRYLHSAGSIDRDLPMGRDLTGDILDFWDYSGYHAQ